MSNTIFWDANSTAGSGQIWSTDATTTGTATNTDRWETVLDSNSTSTSTDMYVEMPTVEQIREARDLMVNIPPIVLPPIEISPPREGMFQYRHDFGVDFHKSDLLKYMFGDWKEQDDDELNKKVHDIFKQAMKN